MTLFYGSVTCHCDECGHEATFDNPRHYDSWTLQTKAILAGWYLPGNGKQRCPRCHLELAQKAGMESMYTTHPRRRAIEAQLAKLQELEPPVPEKVTVTIDLNAID